MSQIFHEYDVTNQIWIHQSTSQFTSSPRHKIIIVSMEIVLVVGVGVANFLNYDLCLFAYFEFLLNLISFYIPIYLQPVLSIHHNKTNSNKKALALPNGLKFILLGKHIQYLKFLSTIVWFEF